MKWWKKALLFSGVWMALTIGVAFVHTSVLLAGKITPEQDSTISRQYGQACGSGVVLIWIIFGQLSKKKSGPKPMT